MEADAAAAPVAALGGEQRGEPFGEPVWGAWAGQRTASIMSVSSALNSEPCGCMCTWCVNLQPLLPLRRNPLMFGALRCLRCLHPNMTGSVLFTTYLLWAACLCKSLGTHHHYASVTHCKCVAACRSAYNYHAALYK